MTAPFRRALCLLIPLLCPEPGGAEVVKVEVRSREAVPDAPAAYELVVGTLHFEVDPAHPRNAIVADIDRAPRTERGTVAFSSDFRLLHPGTLPEEGGFAWVEVPNRGSRSRLAPFAMRHGWIVLEVGWEFDIPEHPDRLNIEVPVAKEVDGAAIEGIAEAVFVLEEAKEEHEVVDLAVYPPVDSADPRRRLAVRRAAHLPGGEEIPQDRWRLKGNRVALADGFRPGLVYEVSWAAQDPPVAGLGFAAIRDAVSWLKHGDDSPAKAKHAAGYGGSQTGRFLRSFVYQGFNTDVAGRRVLDGAIPHVAGAGHLDLNRRWATPRETALFRAARYPFSDSAVADPVSGAREGILENPRVEHPPKLFYTNSSAEYWGGGRVAGLLHTDPATGRDVPPHEQVRLYAFAGAQHGPGRFPPPEAASGVRAYATNPVNFSPVVEALRIAMFEWIAEGRTPPPSVYPSVADGTLAKAEDLAFPAIPGVPSPQRLPAGLRNRNPLHRDGAGEGAEMPLFVPRVDADGNEVGGIRLPEVRAPLATCTGWLFRSADLGAPHELRPVLRGSWIPFARTKEEAAALGDPRPAVSERYVSRAAYLEQTEAAAQELVADRLLLPEHVAPFLESAAQRWAWFFPERD